MTRRIREAMKGGKSSLGGSGKVVEVDETYIGNVRQAQRSKSYGKDKFKVVPLSSVAARRVPFMSISSL